MSCDRTGTLLHAYFDNELDAAAGAEFERHLEQCPECVEQLDSLQTLRSSILSAQLYHPAPASLRKKLNPPPSSWRWQWAAIAAALVLSVFSGWQLAVGTRPTGLAGELVDAHLRSLQPGHLTDVLSSDQHTVKPWFAGKLDFSPPVRDFAPQGFPLQGGRLEIIQGRAGAALVYGRRKHIVSVFIWPIQESENSQHSGTRQGYQWLDWREGGMEFFAVSDAALPELTDLEHLFSTK